MTTTSNAPALRPLLSEEQIARRVGELAGEIAAAYAGREVALVPILSGSLILVADLVRRLPLDMVIHVCGLSSYRGPTTRPDGVNWTLPVSAELAGRHVLVVDDILDSGATLGRVCAAVRQRGPASLRTCVLLIRNGAGATADFMGFRIGPGFVVGYGLDFGGRYRNLPYIAVIEPPGKG